ncbi:DUF5677 domain-containing protein [Aliamphritea hakodatensis]|uniref:DUF5677 domain-containing protein n=1 Tax=Aliamphritea hakodatensis TaxID=2895352 RepID=UPI0022FD8610|nr:DUF5677 domain-containing protein [Aliamphritea hakodatensis]
MFEETFTYINSQLNDTESHELNGLLEKLSVNLYQIVSNSEKDCLKELTDASEAFKEANYKRWKIGFQKLEMLRYISIEAGKDFQKTFLALPQYESDPLLGVLMRQHAHACRITGEIILLLKGGYPSGALARWRTLFEISVNCLVIHKYGSNAAIDFIKYGKVKAAEGMAEYQKTAREMNVQPYTEAEISEAMTSKEKLTNGEPHFHWARKYTGYSKLEKLREHIGLGKWSHNYKLASKYVHADHCEMQSLHGIPEGSREVLLVGPSGSGMVEPAHMTAITLAQITGAFLTARVNDDELNHTNSTLFQLLIEQYIDAVGNSFLQCSETPEPKQESPGRSQGS